MEDPQKVWALASLVSQQNTILKVRRKDTGELVDIDLVRKRHELCCGRWIFVSNVPPLLRHSFTEFPGDRPFASGNLRRIRVA